jgi:hypothetical protein
MSERDSDDADRLRRAAVTLIVMLDGLALVARFASSPFAVP